MTTQATQSTAATAAQSKPDVTNRLTGMWVHTNPATGLQEMAFNDPDTKRRFELAAKPRDDGKMPDEWDVYVLTVGSTDVPELLTTIRARPARGTGQMFMALVDLKTEKRYPIFHNHKPQTDRSPHWYASRDAEYGKRLDRFRYRPAAKPAAAAATQPQAGEVPVNDNGEVPY